MFSSLVNWLVDVIGHMGYPGIIGLMFLESSFFPFPSEVVVPPAGYLAWKGEMNLLLVIMSGITGSILGGLFNYWIAVRWGRPIFEKYGRYFFVTHESLDKADAFFLKHGHISTFTGRLIPVIRQYISLPAGLARMPLGNSAFTRHWAREYGAHTRTYGILFGSNQDIITRDKEDILMLIAACAILTAAYVWSTGKDAAKNKQPD